MLNKYIDEKDSHEEHSRSWESHERNLSGEHPDTWNFGSLNRDLYDGDASGTGKLLTN